METMRTERQHDTMNRLRDIRAFHGSAAQITTGGSYTHNRANQRTRHDLADGSYWKYEYDSLGQVISGNPPTSNPLQYQKDSRCDCLAMLANAVGGEHTYVQHVAEDGTKWGYGFGQAGPGKETAFKAKGCSESSSTGAASEKLRTLPVLRKSKTALNAIRLLSTTKLGDEIHTIVETGQEKR